MNKYLRQQKVSNMRYRYAFLVLPLLMFGVPVKAQQTNIYQVCRTYQENYNPGYYDQYGNYIQGQVNTNSYNTPCNNQTYYHPNNGGGYYPPPVTRPRQVQCDPSRTLLGATLGGGVAASMSRGDAYKWSVPLGAFIGGAAFGCR